MKKMILISLLILGTAANATEKKVRVKTDVNKDRRSITTMINNSNPYDMICEDISLGMDVYEGANREFISTEWEHLTHVYVKPGRTISEKISPFSFDESPDSTKRQYIKKAHHKSTPNCWRKATFEEYCEMGVEGELEADTMDKLFTITRSGSCAQVADDIGTRLNLRDKNITSFEPLKYLTHLKKLYLGKNPLRSIKGIGQLKKLKKLEFNENLISDLDSLAEISQLEELEELKLYRMRLKNLDFVKNLRRLSQLDIRGSNIDDLTGLVGARIKCIDMLNIKFPRTVENLDAYKKITKNNHWNCDSNPFNL